MPRTKYLRRFDPRFGVSREMLQVESKYIARERENYLLLATRDLQVRGNWTEADQVLAHTLSKLPDRDKTVMKCLIIRDLYHLLELCCMHLNAAATSATSETMAPHPTLAAEKLRDRLVPFSEWLFDPKS